MQKQPTLRQVVETALSLVEYPSIKYAGADFGKDISGFDCSGFVVYVLKKIGIALPETIRHCNEFLDTFGVFIHQEQKLPGDLIFFSRSGTRPTHIGIVVSHNHYIHAPGLTDTKVNIEKIVKQKITPTTGQIYQQNPIAFKRISIKSGRWQKLLT